MTPLERRIKQIEEHVSLQSAKLLEHFMHLAIAQYVGNAQKGESPTEAFERALGVRSIYLTNANSEDYKERYCLAREALKEKFGVTKLTEEAFKQMEAGLCDDFKERWRDRLHQVFPPSRMLNDAPRKSRVFTRGALFTIRRLNDLRTATH